MGRMTKRRNRIAIATLTGVLSTIALAPTTAGHASPPVKPPPAACPPHAKAVGFSDALNKTVVDGVPIGGLSAVAYDRRSHGYVSIVDRTGTLPARLWFFRNPAHPTITGTTVLESFNGANFDGEGLAVLPDGDFLVSSETEPSIRVFGRDGKQRGELAVPARFRVAPAGEAGINETLEGLSISPDGRYVYAAMEGTLSGDAPATGEAVWRRILVYRADGHGGYPLDRQVGYRVDPGSRIAEVAAYADGRLVVLESAYVEGTGNTIRLYAVAGANHAPDATGVANLSAAPARYVPAKRLVADVTRCPSLGATSPQPQTNPLMDNYEGMAVDATRRPATVTLISDDNFGANQVTRVLNLTARLP
jgi:hypothetical protein